MKAKQHPQFVRVDLSTGWERPPGYPAGFFQKIRAVAAREPLRHVDILPVEG